MVSLLKCKLITISPRNHQRGMGKRDISRRVALFLMLSRDTSDISPPLGLLNCLPNSLPLSVREAVFPSKRLLLTETRPCPLTFYNNNSLLVFCDFNSGCHSKTFDSLSWNKRQLSPVTCSTMSPGVSCTSLDPSRGQQLATDLVVGFRSCCFLYLSNLHASRAPKL